MAVAKRAAKAAEATSSTPLNLTLPALAEDEFHAGIHFDDKGTPTHWVIGRFPAARGARVTWQEAMDACGEDLPNRRESSLLYANAKQHFERDWYWTQEQYAGNESFAWMQSFYNGVQDGNHKGLQCRVVLVRRVPIQPFSYLGAA